mmetsp:Transcript_20978/g.45430  ORF Transcript_20978/g.45430 Transcript_20978/m.45430 type:complete len:171 (-) Transcript_20978:117-629(-)|eukprot:g10530.t1 g10530   contig4:2055138-2055735(-)
MKKMINSRAIAAITMFVAPFREASAFSYRPCQKALHRFQPLRYLYQNKSCLYVATPFTNDDSMNLSSAGASMEVELKLALEAARDADKTFGLCTPVSQQAWSIVDELYSRIAPTGSCKPIQMVQTHHDIVEDQIRVRLQSSNKNTQSSRTKSNAKKLEEASELRGTRYFF